jgi:hypothetical protein
VSVTLTSQASQSIKITIDVKAEVQKRYFMVVKKLLWKDRSCMSLSWIKVSEGWLLSYKVNQAFQYIHFMDLDQAIIRELFLIAGRAKEILLS